MNMSQMYAVNISKNDVENLQDILESLRIVAETVERKGDIEKSNRIKIMAKTIEDITTQCYICNINAIMLEDLTRKAREEGAIDKEADESGSLKEEKN